MKHDRKRSAPMTSILLGVLVLAIQAHHAHGDTNEVSFVSVTHSNGVMKMRISGPQSQPIVMDYSTDLAEWKPLHVFIGETGVTGRVAFVTGPDGFVDISQTMSSYTNMFFRAILLDFPFVWPPPVSFSETNEIAEPSAAPLRETRGGSREGEP